MFLSFRFSYFFSNRRIHFLFTLFRASISFILLIHKGMLSAKLPISVWESKLQNDEMRKSKWVVVVIDDSRFANCPIFMNRRKRNIFRWLDGCFCSNELILSWIFVASVKRTANKWISSSIYFFFFFLRFATFWYEKKQTFEMLKTLNNKVGFFSGKYAKIFSLIVNSGVETEILIEWEIHTRRRRKQSRIRNCLHFIKISNVSTTTSTNRMNEMQRTNEWRQKKGGTRGSETKILEKSQNDKVISVHSNIFNSLFVVWFCCANLFVLSYFASGHLNCNNDFVSLRVFGWLSWSRNGEGVDTDLCNQRSLFFLFFAACQLFFTSGVFSTRNFCFFLFRSLLSSSKPVFGFCCCHHLVERNVDYVARK